MLVIVGGIGAALAFLGNVFTIMEAVAGIPVGALGMLLFVFCVAALVHSLMKDNSELGGRVERLERQHDVKTHVIELNVGNVTVDRPTVLYPVYVVKGSDLTEDIAPGAEENDVSDLPPD